MFENFVKRLRAFDPHPKLRRDSCDDGVEDLRQPTPPCDHLRDLPLLRTLEMRPETGHIIEQPPCLVLLRVDSGQRLQAPAVMARLDDLWIDLEPDALFRRKKLHLGHVKTQLVQTP